MCDMVAVLELPQSTISRQLMRLRHVGLVSDSRDGMWINYAMVDTNDPVRTALLRALRDCWQVDPVYAKDKQVFERLHSENKIVRCKRGQKNLSVEALS